MTEIGSILAVPGLESKTTPLFRYRLLDMCRRHGWDADAVAAVISTESGFEPTAKNPNASATGLIQFIDSTARSLGVADGVDGVRRMSAVEQLGLVELYYTRVFGKLTPRPVDYYLAGWGRGVGAALPTVLAREDDEKKYNEGKHNLYTLNRGLDRDGNGVITVSDLDSFVRQTLSRAKGRRVPVHDYDAHEQPAGGGGGGAVPPPLAQALRAAEPSASLRRLASSMSQLEPGKAMGAGERQALAILCYLLRQPAESSYTPELAGSVKAYQQARRLRPDGIVGPVTWGVLLAEQMQR